MVMGSEPLINPDYNWDMTFLWLNQPLVHSSNIMQSLITSLSPQKRKESLVTFRGKVLAPGLGSINQVPEQNYMYTWLCKKTLSTQKWTCKYTLHLKSWWKAIFRCKVKESENKFHFSWLAELVLSEYRNKEIHSGCLFSLKGRYFDVYHVNIGIQMPHANSENFSVHFNEYRHPWMLCLFTLLLLSWWELEQI